LTQSLPSAANDETTSSFQTKRNKFVVNFNHLYWYNWYEYCCHSSGEFYCLCSPEKPGKMERVPWKFRPF
jgi:hypothetical protein